MWQDSLFLTARDGTRAAISGSRGRTREELKRVRGKPIQTINRYKADLQSWNFRLRAVSPRRAPFEAWGAAKESAQSLTELPLRPSEHRPAQRRHATGSCTRKDGSITTPPGFADLEEASTRQAGSSSGRDPS
jgi:hypothetical protein